MEVPDRRSCCSSPTIVDGTVYVGSSDSKIYALDAQTGLQIWTFTAGFPIRSSCAVADGKVYTGADDGNVYCLDATTGTQLWKTFAGGVTYWNTGYDLVMIRSSPIVLNGKVYVGSLDDHLYCLNADTGAYIWKFASGGAIQDTPAVIANDGIYFSAAIPPTTDGDPLLGRFVLGNTNFTLYKLDINSGSMIWQQGIPRTAMVKSNQCHVQAPASPTVADGMVFIPNDVAEIYCINATNGEIICTTPALLQEEPAEHTYQGPSILYAGGRLYTNDYFAISCWNATDGEKLFTTMVRARDVHVMQLLNGQSLRR